MDCANARRRSVELSQLMTEKLGDEAIDLSMAGPFTLRAHNVLGSETSTNPLVASAYWQSALQSPRFADVLHRLGASPAGVASREAYVVRHGAGHLRYDLVVFDQRYSGEPNAMPVAFASEELRDGWDRFRSRWLAAPGALDHNSTVASTLNLGAEVAVEAGFAMKFGVVLAGAPEPELCASVPGGRPWSIRDVTATTSSSVGVIATSRGGRIGVTGALHAVSGPGAAVEVQGVPGTVVSTDAITDSCFIEIDPARFGSTASVSGPLAGMTPRAYETVTFEGCTSGRVDTVVTGWSPELPFTMPGSQTKVLTKPVIAPGDSGCALLEGSDRVVGFAFYRTGFGSTVDFAAWIWAESVFSVHALT